MILDNAKKIAETITAAFYLKQVDNNKFAVYKKRNVDWSRPTVYVVAESEEEASIKTILKLRKEKHTIIDYTKLSPNISIIDGEVCKR